MGLKLAIVLKSSLSPELRHLFKLLSAFSDFRFIFFGSKHENILHFNLCAATQFRVNTREI